MPRDGSRACSSNLTDDKTIKDHYDAGTPVEQTKYWGTVNSYFSKTMAYVAKDKTWKRQTEDDEEEMIIRTYCC